MKQIYIRNKKKIYSVDMMIAYVNLNKPICVNVLVKDLQSQLNEPFWGDHFKNELYSPSSVLKNPNSNKKEYNKILKSDLSYPIIIFEEDGKIIDGAHRACKCILEKRSHIDAYMFSSKLLKKFLITDNNDKDKVLHMGISDFIILYEQRFENSKKILKN